MDRVVNMLNHPGTIKDAYLILLSIRTLPQLAELKSKSHLVKTKDGMDVFNAAYHRGVRYATPRP